MTDYKEAVIAALAAMGLKVETGEVRGREALLIAGVHIGCDLEGKGEHVDYLSSAAHGHRSVWRSRRLTGDPKKDAVTLAARHERAVQTRAEDAKYREAEATREHAEDSLRAAFAVPDSGVKVYLSLATFTFSVDNCAPDLAARLAAAINAVLGNESGSLPPSD